MILSAPMILSAFDEFCWSVTSFPAKSTRPLPDSQRNWPVSARTRGRRCPPLGIGE